MVRFSGATLAPRWWLLSYHFVGDIVSPSASAIMVSHLPVGLIPRYGIIQYVLARRPEESTTMNTFRTVVVVLLVLLTCVSCSKQQSGTQSFVDFVTEAETREQRKGSAAQTYNTVAAKQWDDVVIWVNKYDVKKTDSTLRPLIGHVEVRMMMGRNDDNQEIEDTELVEYHLEFTQAEDGSWDFKSGSQKTESLISGRSQILLPSLPYHLEVLFGLQE